MKNIKLTLALVLIFGVVLSVDNAEASFKYKNCKELNAVYKNGVKKSKETVNIVTNRKTKEVSTKTSKATVDLKVYNANVKLDNDSDGIACEK